MANRYAYARRMWHCTLDPNLPLCDLDGKCDECEHGWEQHQIDRLMEEPRYECGGLGREDGE